MAKLTCVYRNDEISGMKFSKRQLPLSTGDNNFMVFIKKIIAKIVKI